VALLNGKLIAEGSLKTIRAPATLADGTIYRRPASARHSLYIPGMTWRSLS
jgi:hypothetical protein